MWLRTTNSVRIKYIRFLIFQLDFVQYLTELRVEIFWKREYIISGIRIEQPIEFSDFRVATYSVEVFKNIRHKRSPLTWNKNSWR